MPIYEYVCSACSHRTDILHGVHESGPMFCPSCGAEGTMRKAIAAPTIHFKGTGWAKKERHSASAASRKEDGGGSDGSDGSDAADRSSGDAKPAADPASTKNATSAPAPSKSTGGD